MHRVIKVTIFLATAAFVLSAARPLRSQEQPIRLTALDELQIQPGRDPKTSQDGKKTPYARRFAAAATDRRYANLWIINSDGSDHRPLTTGNRNDVSPRWSPDGSRLAYLSDADGK